MTRHAGLTKSQASLRRRRSADSCGHHPKSLPVPNLAVGSLFLPYKADFFNGSAMCADSRHAAASPHASCPGGPLAPGPMQVVSYNDRAIFGSPLDLPAEFGRSVRGGKMRARCAHIPFPGVLPAELRWLRSNICTPRSPAAELAGALPSGCTSVQPRRCNRCANASLVRVALFCWASLICGAHLL